MRQGTISGAGIFDLKKCDSKLGLRVGGRALYLGLGTKFATFSPERGPRLTRDPRSKVQIHFFEILDKPFLKFWIIHFWERVDALP